MKFLTTIQPYVKMLTVCATAIIVVAAIFLPQFVIAEIQGKYECAGGFVCCDGPNCDFEAFKYNVMHIIREVLKYAFVFIALMFAWAGFKYMTANGDSGQISEAHDMFKKVAVGTVIVLLSFLIIEAITSALGLKTNIIELIK